jgi:transposase-like protein
MTSISAKIGCTPQTLHDWVRARVSSGVGGPSARRLRATPQGRQVRAWCGGLSSYRSHKHIQHLRGRTPTQANRGGTKSNESYCSAGLNRPGFAGGSNS